MCEWRAIRVITSNKLYCTPFNKYLSLIVVFYHATSYLFQVQGYTSNNLMIPLIKYQNYFHTRSSLSWQPFLLDFSFWFQLCWILPLCPVKDLNLSSLDLTYLSSSLSFASWNFNFLILSDVKFSSTWYFPAWFNLSSYFLCFLFVLLDFNFSSYSS